MGRKSRGKTRTRELAAKKRHVRPDDYFSDGRLEMARFGRHMVMRTNWEPGEYEKAQDAWAREFPRVCAEIDSLIQEIVRIVSVLPPDTLLQRAYWEWATRSLNVKSEIEVDEDAIVALRMIDYVQSIIVSASPADTLREEVSEEDWRELRKLVRALFQKLRLDYHLCRSAHERQNDPGYDVEFDKFYFLAQQYWVSVRGRRYTVHEIPTLRDLLVPHSAILEELFGIDTARLLDNVERVRDSLLRGAGEAWQALHDLQEDTMRVLGEKTRPEDKALSATPSDLVRQIIEEQGWQERQEDIVGRLIGLDLFDVRKNGDLPVQLLDELSWEPGQDEEFLADGEFSGWPLKVWPVFKRPFIKLQDAYYCFDLYSLFDNLYRVIARTVCRLKPEHRQEWNKGQKVASEELTLRLLEQLLSGAETFRSVHYRWYSGGGKTKEWCEVDGLLIYDDHLFVVEVKAGAFTYTSPATDFPGYIESIKNLLVKPATQGERFVEYLESEESVGLFDENHREIGRISRRDFGATTICAVSLDPFTELAAKAQHLKRIGVDVGKRPVWSISMDDLRQYADVFNNPLVFLHFVEERMRAFASETIEVDDEFDHLGLYLTHNIYTKYAAEFGAESARLGWYGYRSRVDEFFAERLLDPDAECHLGQQLPERLQDVVTLLTRGNQSGRRRIASTLLNFGQEGRNELANGISNALERQSITHRPIPLSLHGEVGITVFCWKTGEIDRDITFAERHTRTVMRVAGEEERLLLELTYDANGKLVNIHHSYPSLAGLSDREASQIDAEAATLRRQRVSQAISSKGKIGRNDTCPCGSGQKYKYCCLGRT